VHTGGGTLPNPEGNDNADNRHYVKLIDDGTTVTLRYESQGLRGLVDHRNTRLATPLGRVDASLGQSVMGDGT